MNLHAVMTELAEQLDSIAGLNTFPFYADRVTAPAAVVGWPDPYTYDTTMGRGSDTAVFPIVVVVPKVDDEAAAVELAAYCNGSGASSVKYAIERHQLSEHYDSAVVESVEFDIASVAGVEHLAATFQVSVTGTGE